MSFIFKTDTPLSWKAGQFLKYTLSHQNPDSRKTKRYFSIASAPFEKTPRINTRIQKEKGSTFKKTLLDLPIGATIEAEGPAGDFIVEDPNQPMVFISGGIGITAFRSMLLDLDHRKLLINVLLLYANRTPDFVFKNELEQLIKTHPEFKINYFVDPERITEETIRKLVPDLQKPTFYLSGPEPMVEAFEKMLIEMGVADDRIKRDYFPGYDWP